DLPVRQTGLIISQLTKKDYNFEFTIESGKEKVKIQVYFGKKGIKTVLQGDNSTALFKKVSSLILDEPKLDLNDPELNEPDEYIGSDESGKGDFFGPLVAAAVYVYPEAKKLLLKIGVRDSKELSDNQINILASEIKNIIGRNFYIVSINPDKYNKIYEQFGNLNKMLNWAHSKAIGSLLEHTKCRYVITDKFSKKELDVSSLLKHSDVEFVQETKAEKYIGVAAASILARASMNDWFALQKEKGLNLPKGSSAAVEFYAKEFLKKIGKDKLSEFVKLHFKTFKKIAAD
ncbi:MAG: ribonuclease HIII, partial [Bacteroidota bacterium]